MSKHRNGGKFNGNHTTLTDLAAKVVDIITSLDVVNKISPGVIECGKGAAGGTQKVKIAKQSGCVLLTVRQSRSAQDVRVYTQDVQMAMEQIARALRNNRIPICFKHE